MSCCKRSKKKLPLVHNVSRRQFMTVSGLGAAYCATFDPFQMLLRGLVDGMIAKAQAAGTSGVRNYVAIITPGAPLQWVATPMNPNNESLSFSETYGGTNYTSNGSMNNILTQNAYTANNAYTAYSASQVTGSQGVYMPAIWGGNMPTSSGAMVPISGLLPNTVIFRGVSMLADIGHTAGPNKVTHPFGALPSLTGLVADASTAVMPAVGMGAPNFMGNSDAYVSLKGVTPVLVDYLQTNISSVMRAFINSNLTSAQSSRLNSAAAQTGLSNVLTQLGAYARSNLPGSDQLYRDASNAQTLMKNALGDLVSIYNSIYNRYQSIAINSTQPMASGSGSMIPATGIQLGYQNPQDTRYFDHDLAAQFAVTEYLLVNGYSSSITITGGDGTPILFGVSNGNLAGTDEHFCVDRQASVVAQTYRNRLILAMVNELKTQLTTAGLWSNTLIHVSSEFGREPHIDGRQAGKGGSDHAPYANAAFLFSGAIQRFVLVGNTMEDPKYKNTIYAGNWGNGAPTQTPMGLQTVDNGMVASTICGILGVRNILTANQPLLTIDGSLNVTGSACEAAKNV